MKLAFVMFAWFPHGGLQQDMMRILSACRHRGAEVTVYTMTWEGELPSGVSVVRFPGRGLTRVGRRRSFVSFVRSRTAGTCDAVLGFNKMPGLDFYYAADTCFAEKARRQRRWWYRLAPRTRQYLDFERAIFNKQAGTHIFMLSELQADQYRRHYDLPGSRMQLLPPVFNEACRAPAGDAAVRRAWRDEFSVADGEWLILQVGSGSAVKGVDRSLYAFASLPRELRARARFMLVGRGRTTKYARLADTLGIAGRVNFLPGRDDIPRFLQGADLLLHPARSESAGLILLEAVVAGLPVLTTDTCGYAGHVLAARAGGVCPSPFRQEELNRRLASMLQDGEQEERKRNGIRYGAGLDPGAMPAAVATRVCGDA